MFQTPGNIRGSISEDFHFLGAEKLTFELGFPQSIGLQGRDGHDEFHDKLEKVFEELSSKPAGIPLEKERMIMVGGRVEHNPLSYTLFYETKTEEDENYSQIFGHNLFGYEIVLLALILCYGQIFGLSHTLYATSNGSGL